MNNHKFCKIVIVGDSGVGKSCLLLRFADDAFSEDFTSTIGVDFRMSTINVDDIVVRMQVWDTAGQERFRTITSAYYRNSDAIIICYDVSKRETFDHVIDWYNEVMKYGKTDVPVFLVGNKTDLPADVLEYDALKLAGDLKIKHYYSSSRTAEGVNVIFNDIAKACIEHDRSRSNSNQDGLTLELNTKKSRNCC